MPSFFRRSPTKTKFGKHVLTVHEQWQQVIQGHPDPDVIDEPNFICLMAATAGATVALGGYGMYLREEIGRDALKLESQGVDDPTAKLAHSFDTHAATEAAWRVVTWALLSDLAGFFWKPNYLLELNDCAAVFGFENEYEKRVIAYGAPGGSADDLEPEIERVDRLTRGCLICMIGAAMEIPIENDNIWIDVALPVWTRQFFEGRQVAAEYIQQVEPDGLPIWE